MVATHNQHSIEHTVARMAELGLEPPGEQVGFGLSLCRQCGRSWSCALATPQPAACTEQYVLRKAASRHGHVAKAQSGVSQGVFFGQLLGMADQLTFPLGRSGYRVRLLGNSRRNLLQMHANSHDHETILPPSSGNFAAYDSFIQLRV